MTDGVILFAHGSRDPLWHKPMEAVAAHIVQISPGKHVACAYLEISTPDLATATAGLVALGVQSIAVLPLFLGVGKHAREDLPHLVAGLKTTYPTIQFELRPAVGEDARLIHLLAEIALNGPID